jgi:hypothetical protein
MPTLTPRVFISHSSTDEGLASELLDLLHAGLELAVRDIRCTSVDGYRLPSGAVTDDQLRKEVLEAPVFIGLVSAASLSSPYVIFEWGARWGAQLPLFLLLTPGTPKTVLSGPLHNISALSCETRQQLYQLLEDAGGVLALPVAPGETLVAEIDRVRTFRPPRENYLKDARNRLLQTARRLSEALAEQQDATGGFAPLEYAESPPDPHGTAQVMTALNGCTRVGIKIGRDRQERAIKFIQDVSAHWLPDARNDGSFDEGRTHRDREPRPLTGYGPAYSWVLIAASRVAADPGHALNAIELANRMQAALLATRTADGGFSQMRDELNEGKPSAYATTAATWALLEASLLRPEDSQAWEACCGGARWLAQAFAEPRRDPVTTVRAIPGLREMAYWVLTRAQEHQLTRPQGGNDPLFKSALHAAFADDLIRFCNVEFDGAEVSPPGDPNGRAPAGIATEKERYEMFWIPWATLATMQLLRAREHLSGRVRQVELIGDWLLRTLADAKPNPGGSRFEASEYLFAMCEAARELAKAAPSAE